jgi:hypothetical protein
MAHYDKPTQHYRKQDIFGQPVAAENMATPKIGYFWPYLAIQTLASEN